MEMYNHKRYIDKAAKIWHHLMNFVPFYSTTLINENDKTGSELYKVEHVYFVLVMC